MPVVVDDQEVEIAVIVVIRISKPSSTATIVDACNCCSFGKLEACFIDISIVNKKAVFIFFTVVDKPRGGYVTRQ